MKPNARKHTYIPRIGRNNKLLSRRKDSRFARQYRKIHKEMQKIKEEKPETPRRVLSVLAKAALTVRKLVGAYIH